MKTYKLIFFYYYKCYTGSSLQIRITMSVKPNLDTLMRVIEENQHKMTEGDYEQAIDLLKQADENMKKGEYDFAHINLLQALNLLEVPEYEQEVDYAEDTWDELADVD